MEQVRRPDDDELCGHIDHRDDVWLAMSVFGGLLGRHGQREEAVRQVLDDGLASLAERWTLRDGATGEEELVCIQEANAHSVTLARGYYSLPGVPTLTITARQIASGEWELHR